MNPTENQEKLIKLVRKMQHFLDLVKIFVLRRVSYQEENRQFLLPFIRSMRFIMQCEFLIKMVLNPESVKEDFLDSSLKKSFHTKGILKGSQISNAKGLYKQVVAFCESFISTYKHGAKGNGNLAETEEEDLSQRSGVDKSQLKVALDGQVSLNELKVFIIQKIRFEKDPEDKLIELIKTIRMIMQLELLIKQTLNPQSVRLEFLDKDFKEELTQSGVIRNQIKMGKLYIFITEFSQRIICAPLN